MVSPTNIGVVITTYNSPEWLRLVLFGYENQSDTHFSVLVADDGSGEPTSAVIEEFKQRGTLNLVHFWQPDEGFQKTKILNKVISNTECDYLIFTDGDCIPRNDFVAVHRAESTQGSFLSGGYVKLTKPVSDSITEADIQSQLIFSSKHLKQKGQPSTFKLTKLTTSKLLRSVLNRFTPTKATWNGMNSSGWTSDLIAVNGFDERMQYGGLDRELGERLWNLGLKSKQIRYRAVCLHLDHPRGYSTPETWDRNRKIREEVVSKKKAWTDFGIQSKPELPPE